MPKHARMTFRSRLISDKRSRLRLFEKQTFQSQRRLASKKKITSRYWPQSEIFAWDKKLPMGISIWLLE
ncbi:hypothetical protein AD951_01310 [Acetobacter malorum]|uniref:Uncharacterized protein n=1 Tax=Acetobacter malorum TaxID=178901 RepID=A0A149UW51_9PROT|nr:hypothetical protein AD951_01310 [Acetobacter malorum]